MTTKKALKVYVAGKFEERNLIRQLMDKIEDAGHDITYDWTVNTESDGLNNCATWDMIGVRKADLLFVYAVNDWKYLGAPAEIGGALALFKKVYILGNGLRDLVFSYHPLVTKLNSFDEFLKLIGGTHASEIDVPSDRYSKVS